MTEGLVLVWMPRVRGRYRVFRTLWRVKRDRKLPLGLAVLARWEVELLRPSMPKRTDTR
jgi:hypothetical protein